jgi:hypothetical protein
MASAKLKFLNGAMVVALSFSLAADPDPRDAPEIDEIVVRGTRPSPVPRRGAPCARRARYGFANSPLAPALAPNLFNGRRAR